MCLVTLGMLEAVLLTKLLGIFVLLALLSSIMDKLGDVVGRFVLLGDVVDWLGDIVDKMGGAAVITLAAITLNMIQNSIILGVWFYVLVCFIRH